jgi:transposase
MTIMLKNALCCGIDTASRQNTVCLLYADGSYAKKPFNLANNRLGAESLVNTIESIVKEHGITTILAGTEATSMYDWHLLEYLAESQLNIGYTLKLYRFNAKWIKNFKKSLSPHGKTDIVDSYAIAERLRVGTLPQEYIPDFKYQPLRKLTRFRCHLMKTLAREKNYFLTNLFLKASSFSSIKPFSNTFGATSLAAILEFLSIDEIALAPVETLVEFVIKHGNGRIKEPKETVNLLKKVSRESYRLRPEILPMINLVLASTLNNIRCLKDNIKSVDEAIAKEIKAFRHTLQSVPGIGPVYAAGIIAEIGTVKRFHSQAAVAQFAGLTWPAFQSGDFEAEDKTLSKTGNDYLRYYLIEAADSVRRNEPVYKEFYQKKYSEATKHHHKRALVLTARKLVRLIWALLTKDKLYQPQFALS